MVLDRITQEHLTTRSKAVRRCASYGEMVGCRSGDLFDLMYGYVKVHVALVPKTVVATRFKFAEPDGLESDKVA